MNSANGPDIHCSTYDRKACDIGVVHLGFGAFHRAHQAVYIDDYMDVSGDLRWGIAAVNLRAPESAAFAENSADGLGYVLKSIAPDGETKLRRVRSHVHFVDWTQDVSAAEGLLSKDSVNMVTITVTESGYYTDPTGNLKATDPVIAAEKAGGQGTSVYAYLRAALAGRKATTGAPITILCCDNIRQNGKMLRRNLNAYLNLMGDTDLAAWVDAHATFPCSMVDRITPRPTEALAKEIASFTDIGGGHPIMGEAFMQWVLEDRFAGPFPALDKAGVTITSDVDPYEETKIRILNGGHTCLSYLAALAGFQTFDQAMHDADLFDHFWNYETKEVLPAITIDLPFSKADYLDSIAARFKNAAIADNVSRIAADGMAKFPIFIRPTLEGCLNLGIMPVYGIRSIASWFVFSLHVEAGKIPFEYLEPSWAELKTLLAPDNRDAFLNSQQLWGDIPAKHPEFATALQAEIARMEQSWPV